MLKTLEGTRFAESAIVAVAAKPGGPEVQQVCLSRTSLTIVPVNVYLADEFIRIR